MKKASLFWEQIFLIRNREVPTMKNRCTWYRYSWKHLSEIYGSLLYSLLSGNDHLCAGHVLLLQGYLYVY